MAIPAWCTGETVRFRNCTMDVSFTALLERRPGLSKGASFGSSQLFVPVASVALAKGVHRPYDRLYRVARKTKTKHKCVDNGDGEIHDTGNPKVREECVAWAGYAESGGPRDSVWEVLPVPNSSDTDGALRVMLCGGGLALSTSVNSDDAADAQPLVTLAVDPCEPPDRVVWIAETVADPLPHAVTVEARSSEDRKIEDNDREEACLPQPTPSLAYLPPPRYLSEEELRRFARDGMLVVRGGACPTAIASAKAYINCRLGTPDETLVPGAGIGKLMGSMTHAKPLLDVAQSLPLARMIEQIIGNGKVAPIQKCQAALRFPRCVDDLVGTGAAATGPHVTGRDWHTDGLRNQVKHIFTLLVGVALSDTTIADVGNLCVWRGKHLHVHNLMRWPDGLVPKEGGGWIGGREADLSLMPDLGPPEQLKLRVGDVVLAHSTLPHCGAPHGGEDIRYQLYYRVKHARHAEMVDAESFHSDPWCDLEGVKSFVDTSSVDVQLA